MDYVPPRLWHKKLVAKLTQMGMRQISEEPCLLSMSFLFFLFFVDDIITPENRSQVISFMESIPSGDVRCKGYGRIEIVLGGESYIRDRPNRKLWLCQYSYVDKIAHRFNFLNSIDHPNPLCPPKLSKRTPTLPHLKIYIMSMGRVHESQSL